MVKTYRIESSHKLTSDRLPASAFTSISNDRSMAAATALDGVDERGEQEVGVVCIETGEVVWRSTDHDYE